MPASRSLLGVTLVMLLITSCSNDPHREKAADTTTTATPAGSRPRVAPARLSALTALTALTALGDSVPSGAACHCTPYPRLVATDIARRTRHAVASFDDAVPGFRSIDVLRQLQDNRSAITDVERADAVMIEVGANDIAFSSSCGTRVSCYESRLPAVTANITAIVARVRQLTSRHITVVLLDYWSVWLGGRYAQARGPAYAGADRAVTRAFDAAIHAIAVTTGSVSVDLRTAFRGPEDDHDETSLLATDGDHPNAEGHEHIARAIVDAIGSA